MPYSFSRIWNWWLFWCFISGVGSNYVDESQGMCPVIWISWASPSDIK